MKRYKKPPHLTFANAAEKVFSFKLQKVNAPGDKELSSQVGHMEGMADFLAFKVPKVVGTEQVVTGKKGETAGYQQ